ncbi:hypothetical protein AOLI_G00243170 [Acnodon oligacanthus]
MPLNGRKRSPQDPESPEPGGADRARGTGGGEQVLDVPWRKVSQRENREILDELAGFEPDTEVLKILLCGPIGAGKSCIINSVQRVHLGRNFISVVENSTLNGHSFTLSVSN